MSRPRTVPENDAGVRLDVFVAKTMDVSRARAGTFADEGLVTVNGEAQRKSYRVAAGDQVAVAPRVEPTPDAPAGVEVVHEDDHLMVVSKPAGVVVHRAGGVREGTLVDALVAMGKQLAPAAGEDRPGIVHRLDRDVSGLLIVAKTDEAYRALVAAMKERRIERRYVALVTGIPPSDTGKIDAPVGRHPKHRTRMAVVPEGRSAVTWFQVTRRWDDLALLDVKLETGRTHQIRTHLASIGHPIVGDAAYGRHPATARRLGLRRPFLHAYSLAFDHPVTGEALSFRRDLPSDLSGVLAKLS